METRKSIFTRRSIRKFIPGEISKNQILEIVRAGMYAPSARNGRPWEMIVITERDLLNSCSEANPYASMAKSAAVAIVVCAKTTNSTSEHYYPQDCAAAIENMLLMARDMEFGAVWTGISSNEERISNYRNLLSIPQEIHPIAMIVIGHTDIEQIELKDRFEESKIHWNKWNKKD